jgi:hypothetical protein
MRFSFGRALAPLIMVLKLHAGTRQETRVKWVRKTANVAAHLLAKDGVIHELCT